MVAVLHSGAHDIEIVSQPTLKNYAILKSHQTIVSALNALLMLNIYNI